MRGKEKGGIYAGLFFRITPAYAGKRVPTGLCTAEQQDHPRICGEKTMPCPCLYGILGSPPHMRGKGAVNAITLHDSRITPAYAGKSPVDFATIAFFWDHPRICGEKQYFRMIVNCN